MLEEIQVVTIVFGKLIDQEGHQLVGLSQQGWWILPWIRQAAPCACHVPRFLGCLLVTEAATSCLSQSVKRIAHLCRSERLLQRALNTVD